MTVRSDLVGSLWCSGVKGKPELFVFVVRECTGTPTFNAFFHGTCEALFYDGSGRIERRYVSKTTLAAEWIRVS